MGQGSQIEFGIGLDELEDLPEMSIDIGEEFLLEFELLGAWAHEQIGGIVYVAQHIFAQIP